MRGFVRVSRSLRSCASGRVDGDVGASRHVSGLLCQARTKVSLSQCRFAAAEERIVDFGELLGGTYAVDATNTIQAIGAEGWWGPLTTQAKLVIRGRDGNGNECGRSWIAIAPKCPLSTYNAPICPPIIKWPMSCCRSIPYPACPRPPLCNAWTDIVSAVFAAVAEVVFEQLPSGLVTASVSVGAVLTSGSAFAFAFATVFLLATIGYCIVEWAAFQLTKKTRR